VTNLSTDGLPVAVVTGAARGIGRTIAHDLIARGYHVVVGDLDLAATERTAFELGDDATGMRLDVTDTALVTAVVDEIEVTIGPIEVWVNNAGIMPTGLFRDQTVDLIDRVIDVDYRALVDVTAVVLPKMLARGRGSFINIASATGVKPLAGLAVYSGTKAAVIGYSDALRRELRGSGVHVAVIMPNLVSTAMGAGITPPPGFGAVSAESVSRAAMRALDRKSFGSFVPTYLGPILKLSRLLPTRLQDFIDDRVGTDRIGLGGDPKARAEYLKGIGK
jgi:short-subunit dehydrogenase